MRIRSQVLSKCGTFPGPNGVAVNTEARIRGITGLYGYLVIYEGLIYLMDLASVQATPVALTAPSIG